MAAETGKQLRSSGSSSDESDPAKDEGASNLKRSFECTYCKRGFTNAQALGGHMNIHRKDRAKAKQIITAVKKKGNIYSDDPNNYMMSCRQITPPMESTGYANWEARRTMSSSHDHMYRPAAVLSSGVLNYNTMPAGGYSSEYHRPPGHHHYLEPNLSLRVGPAASNNVAWNNNNNTEDDNHEEGKNKDVDLELRLGPRS